MPPIDDLPVPVTAKGEATRARILGVAARRFGERGYAGTTFAELIKASGLTKGAFYFYFPSKEHLALAVLERQQLRWQERVAAQLADVEGGGMARIRAIGPIVLRMMRDEPGAASIARLSRDLRDVDGVVEQVRSFTRNWVGMVADLIRAAQIEGDAREDVDAQLAAEVLCGAFEGVKDLSYLLDDPPKEPQVEKPDAEEAGNADEAVAVDPKRWSARASLLLQFAERSLQKD